MGIALMTWSLTGSSVGGCWLHRCLNARFATYGTDRDALLAIIGVVEERGP